MSEEKTYKVVGPVRRAKSVKGERSWCFAKIWMASYGYAYGPGTRYKSEGAALKARNMYEKSAIAGGLEVVHVENYEDFLALAKLMKARVSASFGRCEWEKWGD